MSRLDERIIRAAGDLFAERGYGATSVRDIAAAVGVQPASLYTNFQSKEEILARIGELGYEDTLGGVRRVLDEHSAEPATARLDALVTGYVDRIRRSPSLSRIVNAELDRLADDIAGRARRLRAELWSLVTELIAEGQASGEFAAAGRPDLMMTAIRGLGTGLDDCRTVLADGTAPEIYRTFARRIVGAPGSRPTGARRDDGTADGDLVVTVEHAERGPSPSPTASRILKTSLELFARNGYAATSVREIAAAVGLRPPSLYAHFRSKDEILAAILVRAYQRMLRRLDAADAATAGRGATARLDAYVTNFTSRVVYRHATTTLATTELPQLAPELAAPVVALRDAVWDRLVTIIDAGRASGEFHSDEDARATAILIRAMAVDAASWMRHDPDVEIDALVAAYRQFARRIVGAAA